MELHWFTPAEDLTHFVNMTFNCIFGKGVISRPLILWCCFQLVTCFYWYIYSCVAGCSVPPIREEKTDWGLGEVAGLALQVLSRKPSLPSSSAFQYKEIQTCTEFLWRTVTSGGAPLLSNQAQRTVNRLTYSIVGQANQLFWFEENMDETDG